MILESRIEVTMTGAGSASIVPGAPFRNYPNAREFSHKAANCHVSDHYFLIKAYKMGVICCNRSDTYIGTIVAKQIAEGR
jgi:hypothetical protein